MSASRPKIPQEISHAVLTKSRRRCAFCYHFESDGNTKEGQIAHIDRKRTNNLENNLVYLCLDHHNKYDSTTSQSKGLLPEELKTAKKQLEEIVENDFPSLVGTSHYSQQTSRSKENIISIEMYRLRHPVYVALKNFVLSILQDADVSNEQLVIFIKGIEDALFLYDSEVEEYLDTVYKQAIKFRAVQRIIQRGAGTSDIKWNEALENDDKLFSWFEKQLTDGKYLFANYLNVAG